MIHRAEGLSFEQLLVEATATADKVVSMDETQVDPEGAHVDQDNLAIDVLEWIATSSTDDRARRLATQALRPFRTDGHRWYA